ncbi:RNA-binding domain-containing protein [Rufibacter sp. LB8]|uniref:RNA-binding domain-containing protein n=1 Tax=Rufibacter sp. LB8 TaxID=2777781 RepID=UPI00178C30D1|nr:RNA-binding domain-containing protein [Rufibacter sp. LB8]
MDVDDLYRLLVKLTDLPNENEWVEFKENNGDPESVGERLSAISNSASIHNQSYGYLVYGVNDNDHSIVGTSFTPTREKRGNELIEHWIAQRLNPRIDFRIYEFDFDGKSIAIFEIPAAIDRPVQFQHISYIRIGSVTRKLRDFPEKEKKIWRKEINNQFEQGLATKTISGEDVVRLLDVQTYFDLLNLPLPSTRDAILKKLLSDKFVVKDGNYFNITNLGAILFAKSLQDFDRLARKAIRVIQYEGKNKLNTLKDQPGVKGYASGFLGLIDYINDKLPSNEEVGKAFRETVRMYPEIAIRELVANALIHQDFHETGSGPIVEIYIDRIEITNPGTPIITTDRFIDEYQSRNEALASFMRRVGICEEKGSGIDKVVAQAELFQLPAPNFQGLIKNTKVTLYAYQTLNEMDKTDKIRACYQHSCLKYVSNERMTNQTLRERFAIESHNYSTASRIIDDTKQAGLIKDYDPENKSRKHARYLPFWA